MEVIEKIHPATWILWALLMASIATNYVQYFQMRQLDKQLAPVIIRQNIRLFEQGPENRCI